MAFLHIILLGLIILNISICCAFDDFSCETCGTNAEYGKTTNITCRNNEAITRVTVNFCPYNKCSCPFNPEINTFAGIYTSKDGRISLKLDNFAILIFHNVQISDERCYAFYLYSSSGRKPKNIRFTVVAPYTKPQLIRKKETVECTATGGYPDKHLYWFDSHETNLTHNATFMSTQYVDGSFFLNSSLHLDSFVNERTYCCTLNNTSCHSSQNCACMTLEKVRSSKTVSENITSDSTPIVAIVVIAVLAVAVAAAIYFFKTKERYSARDCFSQKRTNARRRFLSQKPQNKTNEKGERSQINYEQRTQRS
nr:ICOS ligand-like [Anolis sagrei ordinatus]XP_060620547.1 ICOS ligand-like [Anolis sagrei ordinatus]XP_060620548.1 ICOS ligand-like [Anolis sagrei ordinatus]